MVVRAVTDEAACVVAVWTRVVGHPDFFLCFPHWVVVWLGVVVVFRVLEVDNNCWLDVAHMNE